MFSEAGADVSLELKNISFPNSFHYSWRVAVGGQWRRLQVDTEDCDTHQWMREEEGRYGCWFR